MVTVMYLILNLDYPSAVIDEHEVRNHVTLLVAGFLTHI